MLSRTANNGKIGPQLALRLRAPSPSAAQMRSVLVAYRKRSGMPVLRRHHTVRFESEAMALGIIDATPSQAEALARDKAVAHVEEDHAIARLPVVHVDFNTRNADVFAHYKSSPPLRDLNGDGVTVQVQDTGFSPHPDIVSPVRVFDCTGDAETRDLVGHGTAIVSQLIGTGPIPGLIPAANVLMARIFDGHGRVTLAGILRASAIALEHHVDIVNMSYGSPVSNPMIAWAIRRMYDANIFLVAAAGNSGPREGSVEYPANYAEVFAVAALTKDGTLAPFSSRGVPGRSPNKPDAAAEGVNIVMARSPDATIGKPTDSRHVQASGTSFAAPIMAGLAAMIRQARGRGATPDAIRSLLRNAASS